MKSNDLAIADFKKVLELTQDPVVVKQANKNITICAADGSCILER